MMAAMLREEQRIAPGVSFAARGQCNRCHAKKNTSAYDWSRSAVVSLLQAREYLGETVNFKTVKASYQAKRQLEQILAARDNAERFLEWARKSRDCPEFTDEQLSLFTDRVIVHETVKDGDSERSRRIVIFLSFIGAFPIPDEPAALTPEERMREEALKKRRIRERRKRRDKRLAKEENEQIGL